VLGTQKCDRVKREEAERGKKLFFFFMLGCQFEI
jgi:hypothetical protein